MAVSKPFRIVMHWTAGGNSANASDLKSYHEIIEGDGSRVPGDKLPESNNDTSDGHYAAHTRAFNTGAIGLAMAGMKGAKESPFRKGSSPISEEQVLSFAKVVAEYAETYDIPIDREHVLSHKEVHHTHGVYQDKWDIMWLPGMTKPAHAVEVGDKLREMIRSAHKSMYGGERQSEMDYGVRELLEALLEKLR